MKKGAVERNEGKERQEKAEPSVFEKPRLKWDGKQDVRDYARRERAAFVGRVLLRAETGRSGLRKPEQKKGVSEKEREQNLKKVFQEKEVALEGLHGKKKALGKSREELSKRFEDFRKAEKTMGHALKPFEGEKRDTLFSALDHELNPEGKRAAKDLKPEEQKKYQEVLGELDSRTMPEERPAMHMAAYMHLKQERILEAEDQLNGTREQLVDREIALGEGERDLMQVLIAEPEAARRIGGVLGNGALHEDQKVRVIDDAMESLGKKSGDQGSAGKPEGQQPTVASFCEALEEFSLRTPELEKQLRTGTLAANAENESLSRMKESAGNEKMIERLPEESGE